MEAAGVSYVDEGDGPPMLLLMGLGASATAWAPHSNAWSRSFRCISVDNPGAGATPLGAEPVTTGTMAAGCARLIEALELVNPVVVGISMGAGIAQELALARPELVQKLVLVAPWARCDAYTRSVLNVLGGVHELGAARPFNELLRNTIWTARWINAHADTMEADLNSPLGMSTTAFREQVQACQHHDTLARLHELNVPTLVTLGDEDVFIRPDLSLEVAARIPGAEVRTFQGAGHVHHWEHLDSFNETIEAWAR